jgi:hypothetical protein
MDGNETVPHRLEGQDLEVFMSLVAHAQQGNDGCWLWPKKWPTNVPRPTGYRVRVAAGYGIFSITNGNRHLNAHRAMYVNNHKINPHRDEIKKGTEIRHVYCETPNGQFQIDGKTYGEWGGNPRCVCPNHLIPGSLKANRLDQARAKINQHAIDSLADRIPHDVRMSIASEQLDPHAIVDKLKLKAKSFGMKDKRELLRDICIIQLQARGTIIYPDGELSIQPQAKLKPSIDNES